MLTEDNLAFIFPLDLVNNISAHATISLTVKQYSKKPTNSIVLILTISFILLKCLKCSITWCVPFHLYALLVHFWLKKKKF